MYCLQPKLGRGHDDRTVKHYFTVTFNEQFVSAACTLVCLSADRVFAMWSPVAYARRTKPMIAKRVLIVVIFLLTVPVSPFLFTAKVRDSKCSFTNRERALIPHDVIESYLKVFAGLFMVGLPATSIASMNILVLYKIKSTARKAKKQETEISVSLLLVTARD